MTFVKAMALVAMAFLWTGSQIPLYLYGAVPPYSMSSIYLKLGVKIFDGAQSTEILEVLTVGHGSFWVTFSLWEPCVRSSEAYQICSADDMLLSVEPCCSLWAISSHQLHTV